MRRLVLFGWVAMLACGLAPCGHAWAEIRLDRSSDVLIALGQEVRTPRKGADARTAKEIREACADLAKHLSGICGARARVGEYAAGRRGPVIHVGQTPLVKREALKLGGLDLEGFAIRTSGANVILVGRTLLGTRHAVYTFMERHCGVRWYFPGDLGTYVPRVEAIVLPQIDERSNPSFLARYFTVHPTTRGAADARQWERRNKLQDHWNVRLKGNSHTMAGVIPTRIYGAKHPEYYAWRKGKRQVPEKWTQERRAAYCLTNPQVIDVCAQWAIKFFDKHPDATSVSMAMNDTGSYCECEKCKAQGVRGATGGPNYADRYFAFVNKVARKVKPRHPDKFIGVLAYGGASVLPRGLKRVEDNVNVYLVTGPPGYNFVEAHKKRNFELVSGWARFARSLCVYTHQFGTAGSRFLQIPAFYPHLVQEHIRFCHQAGVKGLVTEMLPFWAFSPRPWLMARLMWDARLSVDGLMDDFCQRMFSKAAPEMRRYFALLEKAWLGQGGVRSISSKDAQYGLFRPHFAEAEALLVKALRKADGETARARVQFFAEGIKTSRLFARSCEYAAGFTPFPATAKEAFATLRGAHGLYLNERAIQAHTELLEKRYGIPRDVIAPRDKTEVVRESIERCAAWFEGHGFKVEAGLIRTSPAASLGGLSKAELARRRAAQSRQAAAATTGKQAGGAADEVDRELEGEMAATGKPRARSADPIGDVLKREDAILRATKRPRRSAAVGPRVRYVDRSDAARRAGAKLLLHESFDDQAQMAANGASVSGTVRFEPGVAANAAYLCSKDALVAYPLEKIHQRAGTIEFFMKTRWAGRKEKFRVNVVCTGGNFDPPGHLSISGSQEGGRRRLGFHLYFVGGTAYTLIPVPKWQEDTWYHVAGMWRIDPDRPERNMMAFYLNGKPGKSRFRMDRGRDIVVKGPLGFGNRPASQSLMTYPLVAFDELRIHDRPVPTTALSFDARGPGGK